MTDDFADALGGLTGGIDLGAMLEQAQQMQQRLASAQAELAEERIEGVAGPVTVTLTGLGDLTGVSIAPGSFDGADEESVTDLGDLVVAAYRDAKSSVDAAAAQALGPLPDSPIGGLPGV